MQVLEVLIAIAGLGALGMGIYGAAGAHGDDRIFFAVTAVMRVIFATFIFTCLEMEKSTVVAYELTVVLMATLAALT